MCNEEKRVSIAHIYYARLRKLEKKRKIKRTSIDWVLKVPWPISRDIEKTPNLFLSHLLVLSSILTASCLIAIISYLIEIESSFCVSRNRPLRGSCKHLSVKSRRDSNERITNHFLSFCLCLLRNRVRISRWKRKRTRLVVFHETLFKHSFFFYGIIFSTTHLRSKMISFKIASFFRMLPCSTHMLFIN